MPAERDYALVGDVNTGALSVHHAQCPIARQAAEDGKPVMTMFGCRDAPDADYDCPASCLTEKAR